MNRKNKIKQLKTTLFIMTLLLIIATTIGMVEKTQSNHKIMQLENKLAKETSERNNEYQVSKTGRELVKNTMKKATTNDSSETDMKLEFRPTLSEVKTVLDKTHIDKLKYDKNDYNCFDMSYDLIQKFREYGIYACTAEMTFTETSAHMNVAVKTEDYGVIWIEPQNDRILFNLEEGDNYYKKGLNYNMGMINDWIIKRHKNCFN